MEYKIIRMKVTTGLLGVNVDATVEKFTDEVNQQIALGWEPQGGIVTGIHLGPYLLQAMVKRR